MKRFFAAGVLVLALPGLAQSPPTISGVAAPPGAVYEAELTKLANDSAQREMRSGLEMMEKDKSIPSEAKADVKRKVSRLKMAMYTTPKTIDECVRAYEEKVKGAQFIFGERGTLPDLLELARTHAFQVSEETMKAMMGEKTRSARWNSEDGLLQITIEDRLLDPRDGKMTRKTVVLVTSVK